MPCVDSLDERIVSVLSSHGEGGPKIEHNDDGGGQVRVEGTMEKVVGRENSSSCAPVGSSLTSLGK